MGRTDSPCRWKPRPHFYRHWRCQRRRFHPGRHRYGEYTWPRLLQWRRTRYQPEEAHDTP